MTVYAVDLDKTLARYNDRWLEGGAIGEPLQPMVDRIKGWRMNGHSVWIFTSRVCPVPVEAVDAGTPEDLAKFVADQEARIKAWCQEHLGEELPVTSQKLPIFDEIWDDRARHVLPNTGCLIPQHFSLEVGHYTPEAQEMIHTLLATNQELNRLLDDKKDELAAVKDAAMLQESQILEMAKKIEILENPLRCVTITDSCHPVVTPKDLQRAITLRHVDDATLALALQKVRLITELGDAFFSLEEAIREARQHPMLEEPSKDKEGD